MSVYAVVICYHECRFTLLGVLVLWPCCSKVRGHLACKNTPVAIYRFICGFAG